MKFSTILLSLIASSASTVNGFNNNAKDNIVAYWGQNSYGISHSGDQAHWQKPLGHYCDDNTINVLPIAFLNKFFSTGGKPEINLSNTQSQCSGVFAGTNLAKCQFLADDIKKCQNKGKLVTLSLGGDTSANTFSSDAQAQQFAHTVWNMFFGGNSDTRPFGNAVLDGVDLDIEGGGGAHLTAFVKQFRTLAGNGNRKFYVTAAPQCPFPDKNLGAVLNNAHFDHVYVQFYNNNCGLPKFGTNDWNFNQWNKWAKTKSPNKDVKIYIGAPADSTADGSLGGFVSADKLVKISNAMKRKYTSVFGGVMLWDVSQAFGNGRFDKKVKNGISGGGENSAAAEADVEDTPQGSTAEAPPKSSITNSSAKEASTSAVSLSTTSSKVVPSRRNSRFFRF